MFISTIKIPPAYGVSSCLKIKIWLVDHFSNLNNIWLVLCLSFDNDWFYWNSFSTISHISKLFLFPFFSQTWNTFVKMCTYRSKYFSFPVSHIISYSSSFDDRCTFGLYIQKLRKLILRIFDFITHIDPFSNKWLQPNIASKTYVLNTFYELF